MSDRLLTQFHIVLPIGTPVQEAEAHARARLKGALAQFEILKVRSIRSGQILTKHGPVQGELFLIVLQPLGGSFKQEGDEPGEVLYEHPDYKKLIIH